jgi:hypothetical protein
MCVGGPGTSGGPAGSMTPAVPPTSVLSGMFSNPQGKYTGFESPKPGTVGGAPTGILSPTPNQQTAIAKNIAAAAENIPSDTTVSASNAAASNAATARRRTQTRLTGTRRSLLGDPNLGQQSLLG